MERISRVCLLVLGLILIWTVICAADFFVIPVQKCCTCKGTLNGTRWCDNGDGTVTDMTTCLVWLKYADWGGIKPWRSNTPDDYDDAHNQAGLLCDGTLIGFIGELPYFRFLRDGSVKGDWRLPTKKELVGITTGDEPVRLNQPRAFVHVQEALYWSSSTWADFPDYAWHVYFYYDNVSVSTSPKNNGHQIWPVRGGN